MNDSFENKDLEILKPKNWAKIGQNVSKILQKKQIFDVLLVSAYRPPWPNIQPNNIGRFWPNIWSIIRYRSYTKKKPYIQSQIQMLDIFLTYNYAPTFCSIVLRNSFLVS